MDPTQPAGSRRRTTAIIAAAGLACLAIAVPVSGAFGAGESGNDANAPAQTQGVQGYGQGYGQPPAPNGQGQPPDGDHGPRDGNCPKGEGNGQGQRNGQGEGNGSSGSTESDSSGTTLPGDAVEL